MEDVTHSCDSLSALAFFFDWRIDMAEVPECDAVIVVAEKVLSALIRSLRIF